MLETADLVVVALRAVSFILVMQAAGCAIYSAVFMEKFDGSADAHRSVTLSASFLAIVLVIVHLALEPARLTASFSGIWDVTFQLILLRSDAGAAAAVRLLGLAVIAWGAISRREHRGSLMLVGAVITLCSFTLMGHTANHAERWLLSALLIVHLLVAAFWFGALLAFVVADEREASAVYSNLVRDFSVIAGWLVPVIPVAGLIMAIVLLPELASLGTPYGRLLLGKALAFALILLLAAWNKFRLAPALASGESGAVIKFRRVVIVEWVGIAVVLAMTATMTSLFGPGQ